MILMLMILNVWMFLKDDFGNHVWRTEHANGVIVIERKQVLNDQLRYL